MSYQKRLDQAFENVPVLPLDDNHKYVVFSDCHILVIVPGQWE